MDAAVPFITGSVVAVLVPLAREIGQTRRERWQANRARIDELRDILDQAAVALDRTFSIGGAATAARREEHPTDHDALKDEYEQALHEVAATAQRIAVRLGSTHAAYLSYQAAYKLLEEGRLTQIEQAQHVFVDEASRVVGR